MLINFYTVVASLFTYHYNRKMFLGFISVLSLIFLSYPVLSYMHSLYFKSVIPYCRILQCHQFCSVVKVKVAHRVRLCDSMDYSLSCSSVHGVFSSSYFFFKSFTYIKLNSWMNGIRACFYYSYLSFLLREQCPSN